MDKILFLLVGPVHPDNSLVHGIWSFTKVFTSTALGLLIDDGKCTLETKAMEIIPAMAEAYLDVTLRLEMLPRLGRIPQLLMGP